MRHHIAWSAAFAALLILGARAQAGQVTVEQRQWFDEPVLHVVKLSGNIKPGDLGRIRDAWRAAKKRGVNVVGLELQSDGGDVETGLDIANWVRRNRIHVLVRGACWSACSYAALTALAGNNLFVRDNAEIGVHQTYDTGDGTPSPWWTERAIAQMRAAGVMARALKDMAATPAYGLTTYGLGELLAMGAVDMN